MPRSKGGELLEACEGCYTQKVILPDRREGREEPKD